jgi:hypothetical protein
MGVVRVFLEVLLVILTLAAVYLLVEPFKGELRAYVNGIGDPQVRELIYGIGYVVYKLGYYCFTLLDLLFNSMRSMVSYVSSH